MVLLKQIQESSRQPALSAWVSDLKPTPAQAALLLLGAMFTILGSRVGPGKWTMLGLGLTSFTAGSVSYGVGVFQKYRARTNEDSWPCLPMKASEDLQAINAFYEDAQTSKETQEINALYLGELLL
jgi:hypothetical protein